MLNERMAPAQLNVLYVYLSCTSLGIPSVMVFWPLFPGNRPQSIRVSDDNNIKQQRSRILISYTQGVYTWLVPFFYKNIDCEDVVLQVEFIQQNLVTVIFYIVTIYDAIFSIRSSHFQAQLFHLKHGLEERNQ